MALKLHFLILPLWILHPLLQLAIAAVMYQRKLHLKFPIFFRYVVFQVVTSPIVIYFYYFQQHYPNSYFYSFWAVAGISQALGFKIIYELFLDVFKPYHTLKDLGAVLFKWAALVMLLVAGAIATSAGAGQDPVVQAILTMQRCVRIMQCGLVFFLILFANYLRISYKQHSFGIAAGFGVTAAFELFVAAWVAGGHGIEYVGLINLTGYNAGIMVWLGYVLLKHQPKEATENLLVPQRWDQSLMDLQHPLPAESLIPMFETMVEQAFSRAQDEGEMQEFAQGESFLESLSLTPATPPEEQKLANSASASGSSSSK